MGFAQHMRETLPHATFAALSGTRLGPEDENTSLVFGNCIDIDNLGRATA